MASFELVVDISPSVIASVRSITTDIIARYEYIEHVVGADLCIDFETGEAYWSGSLVLMILSM